MLKRQICLPPSRGRWHTKCDGRSFIGIKILNFIIHAYSFTRLRRELPLGGSLSQILDSQLYIPLCVILSEAQRSRTRMAMRSIGIYCNVNEKCKIFIIFSFFVDNTKGSSRAPTPTKIDWLFSLVLYQISIKQYLNTLCLHFCRGRRHHTTQK